MYKSFFNLTSKPFDLLPNPYFLFLSKSHKRALTYLDYAIREWAGFILLTGEIGSGKTTLIRSLINKYHDSLVLARVFNTRVSSEQLISMINDDFEIAAKAEDVGVAKARLPLVNTLALAFLAGAFIALGANFFTIVTTDSGLGFGASRFVGGIAFSLGLILVVIGGA